MKQEELPGMPEAAAPVPNPGPREGQYTSFRVEIDGLLIASVAPIRYGPRYARARNAIGDLARLVMLSLPPEGSGRVEVCEEHHD